MKNFLFIILFLMGLFFLSFSTFNNCQAYDNPLPYMNLTSLAEGILTSVQGLVGWLAVIFIVIGGVLYMTASGKENQLTLAKNTIVASLIGLSLAVGGPSLLKEIKDLASVGTTDVDIDSYNTVSDILLNILDFILTLIVILTSLALIYSGLSYLGAGGDSTKIDKAKKIFLYSITGLLIAGSSLVLIRFVLNLLEGTL
jgi:TRAP-type C4-dicarboxylate transport system permease small subunit